MDKKNLIQSLKKQNFPQVILKAFEKIDRELFIPIQLYKEAYEDIPLSIGHGQTISQPYTIAFMLTMLKVKKKEKHKILEIGSGSGYVLALLSELNPDGNIYGVERIKELAKESREKLKDYKNIKVIYGNGYKGLSNKAPFDRILVSAASDKLSQNLVQQLKIGGILVAPVRNSIMVVEKKSGQNKIREYPGFIFVPLIE